MNVRVRIVPLIPVLALVACELIAGAGTAVFLNALGLNGASVIAWIVLACALLATTPLALSSLTINQQGIRVRLGFWATERVPAGHIIGADAVRSAEKFGARMHGADLVVNGVWIGAPWPMLRLHLDAAYGARVRLWRSVHASSVTVSVSPADWEAVARASRELAASSTRNP